MVGKAGKSDYDRDAKPGRVTLVGAGPGAADLITIRGQNAIIEADVIVYDDLANAELLELAPSAVEKVYVGKRAGRHCTPQAEIGAILVREARAGRNVVRLKGGDPLVFGRAGEEMEALDAAGIPYAIVPGVTAASAAGAAAQISLTQRGAASAVTFVTGHECGGKSREASVDWAALAKTRATLCVYMGARNLAKIAADLRAGGLPGSTPLAVITNATLPTQSVRVADLDSAASLAAAAPGQPALIIVGEVARRRKAVAAFVAREVPREFTVAAAT